MCSNQLSRSLSCTLVFLATVVFAGEATAARFVWAKVPLDGTTLLERSTSDDGRVDADGVWEYLKSMKFKATKNFADLKVDPAAKETVLNSNAPRGQPGTIVVDIAYGGKGNIRKLKLIRVPIDRQGREWAQRT